MEGSKLETGKVKPSVPLETRMPPKPPRLTRPSQPARGGQQMASVIPTETGAQVPAKKDPGATFWSWALPS